MKRRSLLGKVGAFCYALSSLRAQAGLPLDTESAQAARVEEWRILQRLRGHFDGAPWNETVDRWQGRKHQLMQALAAWLVQRQASERQVQQTLGRANTVLRPRDPAYRKVALEWRPVALVASAPAPPAPATAVTKAATAQGTFWLYHWRGTHDQLVLSMHGGRTQTSGWLYAYE